MKRPIPTKAQQRALKHLQERAPMTHPSYLRLRRNAFWEFYGPGNIYQPTLMVPWCGMIIGIEADGYIHS